MRNPTLVSRAAEAGLSTGRVSQIAQLRGMPRGGRQSLKIE